MKQGVLEINDCGLRVFAGNQPILLSPGIAIVEQNRIVTGADALGQVRTNPLRANDQFWRRLSLESLQSDNNSCRHHADLAFAHLRAIAEECQAPEELVLAVPGNFTREQLGLLLGIIRESPFNVCGLVDSAVACLSQFAPPGKHLHLDLQLHQALISKVSVTEGVVLEGVEAVPGAGRNDFLHAWAKVFIDEFIMQSRFDPHHSAASEQRLYDQLPAWVESAVHQGEVLAELDGRTAKVGLGQLHGASAPIIAQIRSALQSNSSEGGIVFLSHLWKEIPGAPHIVSGAELLPSHAIATSIQRRWQEIASDPEALRHVILLSATKKSELPQRLTSSRITSATHLLHGHKAISAERPLFISFSEGLLEISDKPPTHPAATVTEHGGILAMRVDADARLTLNGESIAAPVSLNAGDLIGSSDHAGSITAISVE
ncbi:hypothetical protein [Biformimicrobium ophioploci]|uniref:Uncharacterized protein n=1 Tax=Biformimicrobium ophioploci TaxID=3036711 RepID=A0ABQ6LYQ6_9GAMM|nr:hypothetical protein [Microbulbifer sp. NKW57]GMG87172.1 hypothetical protein MNKW57_14930 [Microbulbifer sp. NKW57]